MATKRKATNDSKPTKTSMEIDNLDDESGDSDEDMDIVNVDFEWFDFAPATDFHGLKTLLRQLLDVDNQLFDLSALADLILAQPQLGSTVKCDGLDSDPFSFMTVLDVQQQRSTPAIQTLLAYLLRRAEGGSSTQLHQVLTPLLAPDAGARMGLILNERFINMPHQTAPPLYRMLATEMAGLAPELRFEWYVVLSKTYREVASQLDVEAEGARPAKKKKGGAAAGAAGGNAEVFYFHPEDEVLQRHAVASCHFDYELAGDEGASDAKRAFQEMGIRPQGHLILLEAARFEEAVTAIEEYMSGT